MSEAAQRSSKMPGFSRLTRAEKIDKVAEFAGLSNEDKDLLYNLSGNTTNTQVNEEYASYFDLVTAGMSENVVSGRVIPYSFAPNVKMNGKDYVVPMAIEESSVVATIGNIARFIREDGGVKSQYLCNEMIGQIQMSGFDSISSAYKAMDRIRENEEEILKIANEQDPILVNLGGGAKEVEPRYIGTRIGPMVVTQLYVDTKDAMGANAVNTMNEAVAPYIEEVTGGRVFLRILSNLADRRVTLTEAKIPTESFATEDFDVSYIVEAMNNAGAFAESDSHRAATDNKGVMNGVDAVAMATGQDYRALEAGAHSYAARNGKYTSLSTCHADDEFIRVTLEMPMAVGTMGGISSIDPLVKLSYKVLGLERGAEELGEITSATGIIQTIGAKRALGMEGINRGHMKLHSRNMAMQAGAVGDEIDYVVDELKKRTKKTPTIAEDILNEYRLKSS